MSQRIARLRILAALAGAQLLAACGGGGGNTAGIEGSGVTVAFTGNVVSSGQITGIGSIYVNGVEYSLDQASIGVNGGTGGATDLVVGQVVTVNGKFGTTPDQAAATTVEYQADLVGPISAVDAAHRQVTVLGQLVSVDDGQVPTLIDAAITPASLVGLTVGREIEVSGFVNSQGSVSARLIRARAPGAAYSVAGVVAQVDDARKTFTIRSLGVDYSGADLGGIAGGAPKNGDVVRVDGLQLDAAGVLHATRVATESLTLSGTTGDTAVVEGWITRYVSNQDFDVNGHPVVGTAQMTISPPPGPQGDPFGISSLRLDRFVTVYGQLRSDGRIDAIQVAIANNVWANITTGECTSANHCDAGTQVVIDGAPASPAALRPGDLVTSYNYWLPDYTKLTPFKNAQIPGTQDFKRKITVVEHTLRGPLESVDPDTGTLRILGQTVVAGLLDTYAFGNPGGSDNGYWRDQKALAALAPGQMLEISGYETPHGEIVATGIEDGSGKDLRVIGSATAVDAASGHLRIGALDIDASAAFMEGFAGATLQDGDRVLATGTARGAGGALLAQRVALLGREIRGARGTVLRFDGAITRYNSISDFDVAGLSVALTPTVTQIDGCGTPRVGAFISIFGLMDADGQIRSNLSPTLWCTPYGSQQLQGPIESIDPQRGVVTVMGVRLAVFEQTLIGSNGGFLALGDLAVGDTLQASGSLGLHDHSWTRVALTRMDGAAPYVDGGVQSAGPTDLQVAGVAVHTDAQTTYGDYCGYDRPAAEAFDYLASALAAASDPQVGPPTAHVDGNWSAPQLVATHVQLYGMPIRPTDADCSF